MGRSRGKAKKLTVNNLDDNGSGEEEKIPVQKRRGRPQKLVKGETNEEELDKLDVKNWETRNASIASKEENGTMENGKKRKRNSLTKEQSDLTNEENGVSTKSSSDVAVKLNGFRHNGSRRKSKPRRAAEAVVECK